MAEEKRTQHFYTKDKEFSKDINELPAEFHNQIILGDAESVLKRIPTNSIDLIFTSPPYNLGIDYNDNDDRIDWEEYLNNLFNVFEECIRVLKYGGRIVINIQPAHSQYVPTHHIISNYFIQKKMIWKTEIVWEKNHFNCHVTAWGSWKSPSNPYIKGTWEFIEVFCKGSLKKEREGKKIDITGDEFKKWVNGRWNITPETRMMKKYDHPAMFPEELAKRVMKLFSYKGDIVLDCFNGAGTTTTVAKDLGRVYVGIDNSEKYCDIARKRFNKQLSLFQFIEEDG